MLFCRAGALKRCGMLNCLCGADMCCGALNCRCGANDRCGARNCRCGVYDLRGEALAIRLWFGADLWAPPVLADLAAVGRDACAKEPLCADGAVRLLTRAAALPKLECAAGWPVAPRAILDVLALPAPKDDLAEPPPETEDERTADAGLPVLRGIPRVALAILAEFLA